MQFIIGLSLAVLTEADETISQKCRRLLICAVKKNCFKLPFIIDRFRNGTIRKQMYNDLDAGIDYGCIFTSGCQDECNKCPLCMASKEQVVHVLSGIKRSDTGECKTLVNCATECVQQPYSNFTVINYCLRHECAYHCFDGTCPKCSAFITRLFNQICVSAELRKRTSYKGQCYEMFAAIVYAKFEEQFDRAGKRPVIGGKALLWLN